ncbi:Retinoid isomerohydrolase [Desmophyllum pertusum]|uniref:Retinoid isomerohydrolase n=1 Tax=Desmophyllum pertusum TaxID=174260 RepID=A0A9X0CG35_9CNID|nr:Retinoid isomerohydrolase [Desmophyllum pertusum]
MEELYQTVKEQVKPVEAQIDGVIPPWLNGSLLRNGPAMYEVGPEAYKHWFDGLGMLQNFKMENGKVTYCSRYLRSQAFVRAEARRGIAYAEFGTPLPPDPCKNIFARFFSYFVPPERTDNCSINVVTMNGQTFASSDSPFLIGFDPSSLQALAESLEVKKSSDKLSVVKIRKTIYGCNKLIKRHSSLKDKHSVHNDEVSAVYSAP